MKAAPVDLAGTPAQAEALIREARRRQHRRYAVIGTTIAVLAGVAGLWLGHLLPGGRHGAGSFFSQPGAASRVRSGTPEFYAYTVAGPVYRSTPGAGHQNETWLPASYLSIRATATGRLLARLAPPRPYNEFGPLTANFSGRLLVFGMYRTWSMRSLVLAARRDLRTPMTFMAARISAGGRVATTMLSLPETLTPGQNPSIALSTDGSRLAVAYGRTGQTAVVQVITLATGRVRQWTLPRASWHPVLNHVGAWTAAGRVLVFAQAPSIRWSAARRRFTATHYFPFAAVRVGLLDTASGPGSLAAARTVVLRAPAGDGGPAGLVISPDGTRLIGSVEATAFKPGSVRWTGSVVVYSARTGVLVRTVAPYSWHDRTTFPIPYQTVLWSDPGGQTLVLLQPRHGRNDLAVLTPRGVATANGARLPAHAKGYRRLQSVLRGLPTGTQTTW